MLNIKNLKEFDVDFYHEVNKYLSDFWKLLQQEEILLFYQSKFRNKESSLHKLKKNLPINVQNLYPATSTQPISSIQLELDLKQIERDWMIYSSNLKSCFDLKWIVEDKSCYKIELEMELVLDLIFLLLTNTNLSILSYFGNKKEIPLLFFERSKEMIEKIKKKTLKIDFCQRKISQIG